MGDFDKKSGNAGRLIILCGLPGSGKTTLAKRLETQNAAIRLCPDEWMDDLGVNLWDEPFRARVEALQWRLAKEWLALGHTVLIEWGTWGRSERDTLRLGARELGAAVELRFFDEPVEELFARVQRRGTEGPPLTLDDLRRYEAVFQRPTPEESNLFDPPYFDSDL